MFQVKPGIAGLFIFLTISNIHLGESRHPREGGDPAVDVDFKSWIPAFAGMTTPTKFNG